MYAKDAVALGDLRRPVGRPAPPGDHDAQGDDRGRKLVSSSPASTSGTSSRFYGGYEYQQLQATRATCRPALQCRRLQRRLSRRLRHGGAELRRRLKIGAFPDAKVVQVLWVGGEICGAAQRRPDHRLLPCLAERLSRLDADLRRRRRELRAQHRQGSRSATSLKGTNNAKCAGTEDAISGVVDWRPWKRVDVYAGAMYSKVRGGLANGFYRRQQPGCDRRRPLQLLISQSSPRSAPRALARGFFWRAGQPTVKSARGGFSRREGRPPRLQL